MGVYALVVPAAILAPFGVPVESPDGRAEVRAVYGGFGIAVAALLGVAAAGGGDARRASSSPSVSRWPGWRSGAWRPVRSSGPRASIRSGSTSGSRSWGPPRSSRPRKLRVCFASWAWSTSRPTPSRTGGCSSTQTTPCATRSSSWPKGRTCSTWAASPPARGLSRWPRTRSADGSFPCSSASWPRERASSSRSTRRSATSPVRPSTPAPPMSTTSPRSGPTPGWPGSWPSGGSSAASCTCSASRARCRTTRATGTSSPT